PPAAGDSVIAAAFRDATATTAGATLPLVGGAPAAWRSAVPCGGSSSSGGCCCGGAGCGVALGNAGGLRFMPGGGCGCLGRPSAGCSSGISTAPPSSPPLLSSPG